MNIAYVRSINFRYRKLVCECAVDIKQRKCYLEQFEYLVKNRVVDAVTSNGVLFNMTSLSHNTVYELDDIRTKYEATSSDLEVCTRSYYPVLELMYFAVDLTH